MLMSGKSEEADDFTGLSENLRAQLFRFIQGGHVAETRDKPRDAVKEHLFTLVQSVVKACFIDSELLIIENWENTRKLNREIFIRLFRDVPWYSSSCSDTETTTLFMEIFSTLASQYSETVTAFLSVLGGVICTLNPPDKHEKSIRLLLLGMVEIIYMYPSMRDNEIFEELDDLLYQELQIGLKCVPSLASGRIFLVLSVLRVTIEVRGRTSFASNLRKILIIVISKTWQREIFPAQKSGSDSCNLIMEKRVSMPYTAENKSQYNYQNNYQNGNNSNSQNNQTRENKDNNVLVEVAENVTERIYGENDDFENNGNNRNNSRKRKFRGKHGGIDGMCEGEIFNDIVLDEFSASSSSSSFPSSTSSRAYDINNGTIINYFKGTETAERIQMTENVEKIEKVDTNISWFTEELLFWRNNCKHDYQLTSTVLLRVISWFSNTSSSRLFLHQSTYTKKIKEFSPLNNILPLMLNNIIIDLIQWAQNAISIIFDDLKIADNDQILPIWTGISNFFVSEKSKKEKIEKKNEKNEKNEKMSKKQINKSIKKHFWVTKYSSFMLKFDVLKAFLLCSVSEAALGVDMLVNYLLKRVLGYFESENNEKSENIDINVDSNEEINGVYCNNDNNDSNNNNNNNSINNNTDNINNSGSNNIDGTYSTFSSSRPSDFISFTILFEFLIQLLSHISPHILRDEQVFRSLKKIITLALRLRRRILYDYSMQDYINEDGNCGNEFSSNEDYRNLRVNTDPIQIKNKNSTDKNNENEKNEKNEKNKQKIKKFSILSLVSLTSGIGYVLIQRFSSKENLEILLGKSDETFKNVGKEKEMVKRCKSRKEEEREGKEGNEGNEGNEGKECEEDFDFLYSISTLFSSQPRKGGSRSSENDDNGDHDSNDDYDDSNDDNNNNHDHNDKNNITITKNINKLKANESHDNMENIDIALAHPAILIIINIFFLPQIGAHNCDEKTIKTHCKKNEKNPINPSEDFTVLNYEKFLHFLPSSKPALIHLFSNNNSPLNDNFYGSTGINKDGKKRKNCFLPCLHSLGVNDFLRLTNRLTEKFEKEEKCKKNENDDNSYLIYKGKKIQRSVLLSGGMDLSLFASDILIHILSFLSFKRVCRMSCVSSSISNASSEHSLWEILYRRKFRNLLFENSDEISQNSDNINGFENNGNSSSMTHCSDCFVLTFTKGKKGAKGGKVEKGGKVKSKKSAPCYYESREHSWMTLFQNRAIAHRKVVIRNSKKQTNELSLCPYVGCLFTARNEEQNKAHLLSHKK